MSAAGSSGADITPDDALAMDYALGALPRQERKAAETRLRNDAALRLKVEAWQAMLNPLDEETAPELPPGSVWAGVMAEIEPLAAAPAAEPPARASLWQSLALWRGLALGGPALAALATAYLAPVPASAPVAAPAEVAVAETPPPLLSANLAGADGTPLLAATWDPLRGTVVLTPAAQRDDAGKDVELWVIEGDKPPRSLGVIAIKAPNAHAISSQAISGLQAGATLAISVEPIGGSPTGLPTGPVIATGKLSTV